MSRMTTTTRTEAADLLRLLKTARTPQTAADLARRLGLPGLRETQRRHIRALAEQLRSEGCWVVASDAGYLLTTDAGVWRDYLEGRKIDGKRVIGTAHRAQRMLTDAAGQGLLFTPPR